MSSNVGLTTPRGSGTSGYVQRNLSLLKPRSTGAGAPYTLDAPRGPKQRKPDQAILTHDRLREVEVKVLELRDKLEDQGELEEDDIDAECDGLRKRLVEEMERKSSMGGRDRGPKGKGLKGYQVHELAEAKAVESEKLRRALGLKGEVKKDGDGDDMEEHPMARQERRRKEREAERVNREEAEREQQSLRERERVGERERQRSRSSSRSLSRSRSRSRSP